MNPKDDIVLNRGSSESIGVAVITRLREGFGTRVDAVRKGKPRRHALEMADASERCLIKTAAAEGSRYGYQ